MVEKCLEVSVALFINPNIIFCWTIHAQILFLGGQHLFHVIWSS